MERLGIAQQIQQQPLPAPSQIWDLAIRRDACAAQNPEDFYNDDDDDKLHHRRGLREGAQ